MSSEQQFWLNWFVQLLIGLSTLFAVLVALFGDWLRQLAPPKLRISLLCATGEETDVTFKGPNQRATLTKARWYHIKVENARRWAQATQVQVFLLRIEEPDAADQFRATWTGEIPLKWRHIRSMTAAAARDIGYPCDADLVSLFREGPATSQPFLQLQPLIAPSPLEGLITRDKKCRLRVVLLARGMQADSNYLTVEIAWSGTWPQKTDDPCMVVKEVA
jgi:hypothetical protein